MHLVDITMFYAAEGGGVSTYLNAKARWLAQRSRVRHTILSPNVESSGAAPSLMHVPGIALPGFHGYRMPLTVGAPARMMRRMAPDLIEAGDAGHGALAALRVKRRLGVPAVAFYHSDLPQLVRDRLGLVAAAAVRTYLGDLYRRFDLVLAPSQLMVRKLGAMGVQGALHQPLGIDAEIFHPRCADKELRRQLQLPAATRLLVYAGRFTPEKKLALLIEAVRRLGRPYHLLLIGGGAALPGAEHISHLPFCRDQRELARLLASCDVLVHPGDCETFGLIVLEAMACGLPVVATSAGGVAELVDPGTGVLVEPNSVAALCAGIDAVFGADRERLSAAAFHKTRALYDWNAIMPQLMQRYGRLLASQGRTDLDMERLCVAD